MNTIQKTAARGCGNWLEHTGMSKNLGAMSYFRVVWGTLRARAVEEWLVSYLAFYRQAAGR